MEYAPTGIESGHHDSDSGPDHPGPVIAVLFNDPGCPFGYSASPALRTLEWRYRDQLAWHLVTIGLSDPAHPSDYGPVEQAADWVHFRDRYGMPFSVEPKSRAVTTARACQAITAARLLHPGSEWRVFRALQLLHFNTPLLFDDDAQIEAVLGSVPGVDPAAVVDALDSAKVTDAYRSDRDRSRAAAGGAAELQARTAESPEGVRFTAPSVVFSRAGRTLEIGGFQPIEAYDAAIANLDPGLNRIEPADDPEAVLRLYPGGLTTREIAAVRSGNLDPVDQSGTERLLIELLGAGRVRRVPLGNDALWFAD